jgi:hypothetical protein
MAKRINITVSFGKLKINLTFPVVYSTTLSIAQTYTCSGIAT